MPTKTSKTYSSYYGNDVAMNQTSNTGVDTTIRELQDGFGNNTSVSLSTNHLKVKPQASNSTTTVNVTNLGGDSLFTVNTTDSVVKCGTSQINALTQYQYFSVFKMVPVAGTHMVLSLGSTTYLQDPAEWNLGTGLNPATTLDISGEADSINLVNTYWYLPDAITVDAVHVLMGGDDPSGSADDLNFQLYSYAIDTSTNHGDLSDAIIVAGTDQDPAASSSFVSDVHEDAIKYQTLANTPTDVAAGRIILATVESTGTDNISINMTVKYHIQ
tara:strand:+ start:160 stop:975 length:816 start_codon:yes stop_codon:yes gene_type:complete